MGELLFLGAHGSIIINLEALCVVTVFWACCRERRTWEM